jgi:hypothetical protein
MYHVPATPMRLTRWKYCNGTKSQMRDRQIISRVKIYGDPKMLQIQKCYVPYLFICLVDLFHYFLIMILNINNNEKEINELTK